MKTLSLPWEIWAIILRLVTVDASAPEIAPSPSSYDQLWTNARVFLNLTLDYDHSLKIKVSTVQVCKQWRDIATKFLYEDVRLENRVAFKSFASTLRHSSAISASDNDIVVRSNHPYSRLPVRLIATLFQWDRRSDAVEPDEEEDDFRNLDTILSLCVNLKALRMMGVFMPPDHTWSEATRRPLHNLQSLELDSSYASDELLYNARNSENLEVLSIDDAGRGWPHFSIPGEPGLYFTKLHTMRLFHMEDEILPNWISTWELPSLSRVTFGIQKNGIDWEIVPYEFFVSNKRLRIKSLDYSPSLSHLILTILRACTSLVHLVLHHSCLPNLDNTCLGTVPELTRIDIRLHGNFQSPAWTSRKELALFMERMRVFGSSIVRLKPNLERLRLSDMENHKIQNHSWSDRDSLAWQSWIEDFRISGVRFEDAWGDLVDIGR